MNKIKRILIIGMSFIFIFNSVSIAEEKELTFQEIIQQAQLFKKSGRAKLNFEKIDLKLLSYFIAELTDKNLVIDPNIKGDVSLIFSKPISIRQAWDIYTAILKSKNYNAIDKGAYVEIVPEGISRKTTPPIITKTTNGDKIATFVYELKNADMNSVMAVLRGLKSPRGNVLPYNPSRTVIITDFASNISVMKNVLDIIDSVSPEEEVKIYRLQYANSSEVASSLNVIFSDLAKKGMFFKVYNLKSQNAVIVKAPRKVIDEISEIVKKLDVQMAQPTYRKFWTVYLKNSKAEDLANILNKLLENIQLVSSEQEEVGTTTERRPQKTEQKKYKTRAEAIKAKLEERYREEVQKILERRKAATTKGVSKEEKPKVIADKSSNALVIYANQTEFDAIKSLIENLDRRRKQVLVSALVTEVSESALKEIGVRWQILGTQGGVGFRGGLSKEDFYSAVKSSGMVAGVLSSGGTNISIGNTTLFFPDLVFLLSLLETGSGFNIISSPKILTMDNQEATINVAQVVPFAESTKFDINGNPIITYDYKEVGLKLKVTPHISGEKVVAMELHQEINEVTKIEKLQLGQISYALPTTSKRELDTTITVENGKTVVLGGLISKKTVKSIQGVPFFSKLPFIGHFFKFNSDEMNKTNLFVFITPFIINSPEDLAKITEEHKKISEELMKLKEKKLKKEKKKKKLENKEKKDIFEEYNKYFGG